MVRSSNRTQAKPTGRLAVARMNSGPGHVNDGLYTFRGLAIGEILGPVPDVRPVASRRDGHKSPRPCAVAVLALDVQRDWLSLHC